MPTDIESLAKELWQTKFPTGREFSDLIPESRQAWFDVAAHVLRREADAELRGLVAAQMEAGLIWQNVNGTTRNVIDAIQRLIAAHHAKWEKPKCEHKAWTFSDCEPGPCERMGRLATCVKCGATRQRGWTSDWQEAGK